MYPECSMCGEETSFGIISEGVVMCDACAHIDRSEHPDTPSLQDLNPEAYGAAFNINPYGYEGGY